MHSVDIKENFEKLEGKETTVAGRIIAKRDHGKIKFIDLQDEEGRPVYCRDCYSKRKGTQ